MILEDLRSEDLGESGCKIFMIDLYDNMKAKIMKKNTLKQGPLLTCLLYRTD